MKRLIYPLLLVLASLVTVIAFTVITASTLASYHDNNQPNKTLVIDQSAMKVTARR